MESAGRKQFTFYRSFLEAVEMLPQDEQLPVLRGIARFALDGIEPADFGPFGKVAWASIRPVLESGRAKAAAGAAVGSANLGKPCPAKRGNRNAAKGNGPADGKADLPGRARFVPPTAAEVAAFAVAEGVKVDAQAFVDHFTSNGWKVGGKAAMKDWRAAARNWARRDKSGGASSTGGGAPATRHDLFPVEAEL